ncbi:glycosyltransferase family 4 protein [Methylocystis parvus]|uniref:Glycosyltransferase family 4 protein n=1 Tax=Methylocystis parvus TaxID=134 RepID=A0A6B8M508_9HYPH|nr:glycosyltransferase [Methylocystis parvus]QGM99054.1 glycosyltransferase family 4 protein [Methylocystis parvus]WBK00579.1 glycosyltransferase family 4 protein [Methylocystis parvus OBBP]
MSLACEAPAEAGLARGPRVLIVTARFLPEMGGIETHVREVVGRLVARGVNVQILTTDRSGLLPKTDMAAGAPVRRVKAWPARRDYYFAPGVFWEILKSDCDVIHIQGCHTLAPPLAMLAALLKGVPYIVTFHSGGHSSSLRNQIRGAQWTLLAPLFRRAAGWIGVSRYEADFFARKMRLPRDRIEVVPNGAAMPRVLEAAAPEELLIASIGRLEKYKGHHRAIGAFAEVLKRHPEARLQIVGEGPYLPELEALVERLGLHRSVRIGGVPPQDREGMSRILSRARLVVLLSAYEAHPVAVMEALAMGRPVLATNCSGFIELAEQSMIHVVEPEATDGDIADAMERILQSPASKTNVELPSWDACVDRVAALLDRVALGSVA